MSSSTARSSRCEGIFARPALHPDSFTPAPRGQCCPTASAHGGYAHRRPAPAPSSGHGLEHAGARRSAAPATAVGREIPAGEVVPITFDQRSIAGMAIRALAGGIVNVAGIDVAQAVLLADVPCHAQRSRRRRRRLPQERTRVSRFARVVPSLGRMASAKRSSERNALMRGQRRDVPGREADGPVRPGDRNNVRLTRVLSHPEITPQKTGLPGWGGRTRTQKSVGIKIRRRGRQNFRGVGRNDAAETLRV
jgi:hypothetical protein